jgi:hypothetical protein
MITMTLTKEWFDLILSGVKTEEYREIKAYWAKRLIGNYSPNQEVFYRGTYLMPFGVDKIRFRNGYSKEAREMIVEWKSLEVKCPKIDWCPKDTDYTKFVFCLNLGRVLSSNCN